MKWYDKVLLVIVLLAVANLSFSMSFEHSKLIFFKLSNNKPYLDYHLEDSWEVNASQYNGGVYMYKGMLTFAHNDDEMALVIAHEIAHFQLGHWTSTPTNEFAADKLGARIAAAAGYNVCRGAILIKRFKDPGSKTHPSSDERYKRLASSCK